MLVEDEITSITGNLFAEAIDADGQPLQVYDVRGEASYGTFTWQEDGAFRSKPGLSHRWVWGRVPLASATTATIPARAIPMDRLQQKISCSDWDRWREER